MKARSPSVTEWLRNRAYDAVFHVGDTALQFTADLIRGYELHRHQSYTHRQLDRQERTQGIHETRQVASNPEKPLNYSEKQAFLELTERMRDESVIEHWKRRKELLAHPHKRDLIEAHAKVQAEYEARSIGIETHMTAEDYQRERIRKQRKPRHDTHRRKKTLRP